MFVVLNDTYRTENLLRSQVHIFLNFELVSLEVCFSRVQEEIIEHCPKQGHQSNHKLFTLVAFDYL